MNYLGHAHVAARRRPGDHAFAFGAMLPDLARLVGVRFHPRNLDASVDAGVDFHHRTDDAFHAHPHFVITSAALHREAESAGLPRGASRVVGHVGFELMLDGELVRSSEASDAYLGALRYALDHGAGSFPGDHDRWSELVVRLLHFGVPAHYSDAGFVADRLWRLTASRPRLAFDGSYRPLVAGILDARRDQIAALVPAIVHDVIRDAAPPSHA